MCPRPQAGEPLTWSLHLVTVVDKGMGWGMGLFSAEMMRNGAVSDVPGTAYGGCMAVVTGFANSVFQDVS